MATGPWVFYDLFRRDMGAAVHDLGSDGHRWALFTSASNAATDTLSLYSELTGEVVSANGYALGGKLLAGSTWAVGASAGQWRFDTTLQVWTAGGGPISAIKFAVQYKSVSAGGGPIMSRTQLSTSQFSIGDGNTLTITPNSYVFHLA